jgi:hypothetical protein
VSSAGPRTSLQPYPCGAISPKPSLVYKQDSPYDSHNLGMPALSSRTPSLQTLVTVTIVPSSKDVADYIRTLQLVAPSTLNLNNRACTPSPRLDVVGSVGDMQAPDTTVFDVLSIHKHCVSCSLHGEMRSPPTPALRLGTSLGPRVKAVSCNRTSTSRT